MNIQNYINEMEKNDNKFQSHANGELKERDIITKLNFRKRKNKDTGNDDDNNNIYNKSIYIEENQNVDKLARIINHTEYQLSDIISDYNLNLTVIELQLQDELLIDPNTKRIKESHIDEYLALFQVSLWTSILDG